MQSDGLNSALSPVVYGDIALSIKINTQKNFEFREKQVTSDNAGNLLVLDLDLGEVSLRLIMSTPLVGGYIIFAFSAVWRPMSGVTHGFRSFKGKVLELLSPNLVCRLIGSVACLGLLLAVVPLLLTE